MSKKKQVTREELMEIRKHNKAVLDKILKEGPDYQIRLGKKYYGDNFLQILDGKHPARTDRHRENTQKALRRAKGEKVPYKKTLQDLSITQWDKEGNKLGEYDNARAACEELGWEELRAQSLIRCARGEHETAYNFVWKFDEEHLKRI